MNRNITKVSILVQGESESAILFAKRIEEQVIYMQDLHKVYFTAPQINITSSENGRQTANIILQVNEPVSAFKLLKNINKLTAAEKRQILSKRVLSKTWF